MLAPEGLPEHVRNSKNHWLKVKLTGADLDAAPSAFGNLPDPNPANNTISHSFLP
jgi:hypothetical protein